MPGLVLVSDIIGSSGLGICSCMPDDGVRLVSTRRQVDEVD